jgi:hypothetical protein
MSSFTVSLFVDNFYKPRLCSVNYSKLQGHALEQGLPAKKITRWD